MVEIRGSRQGTCVKNPWTRTTGVWGLNVERGGRKGRGELLGKNEDKL